MWRPDECGRPMTKQRLKRTAVFARKTDMMVGFGGKCGVRASIRRSIAFARTRFLFCATGRPARNSGPAPPRALKVEMTSVVVAEARLDAGRDNARDAGVQTNKSRPFARPKLLNCRARGASESTIPCSTATPFVTSCPCLCLRAMALVVSRCRRCLHCVRCERPC